MVFPQLGVHDVEGLIALLETLFDERAEYPVLLVEIVEESAYVPVLAETAAGALPGTAARCHVSSPACAGARQSRAGTAEQIVLLNGLAQAPMRPPETARSRSRRLHYNQDSWN